MNEFSDRELLLKEYSETIGSAHHYDKLVWLIISIDS